MTFENYYDVVVFSHVDSLAQSLFGVMMLSEQAVKLSNVGSDHRAGGKKSEKLRSLGNAVEGIGIEHQWRLAILEHVLKSVDCAVVGVICA